MLVEINLLPQKEPKKIGLIITLSSLLALLLIIGGIYYFQIHSVNNEMASLDRQISMTKKIADKEQSNAQAVESSSSVNQLKSAIDWANNYPIQTVPVMNYLSSLLPERGFIQSFSYTETGTVTLSVQFDSSREAAYFLDSLNQSKWIEEASLSSLSTTTIESNTAGKTAVPNSQTNTASTSSTTSNTTDTNKTTSTAGGTNQNTAANSTNTANQTNSTTTATVSQSDQNGTTVKQTAQNSMPNTTTNSSTTNNSTNSAAAGNNPTSNNYLPRYTGSFEIKFNNDYIKKVLKRSKQNEEGVTGS